VALGKDFPQHYFFPISVIISPFLLLYLSSAGWKIGLSPPRYLEFTLKKDNKNNP
jgi:hypothetical protein